jgi:hypothetical protein
MIYVLILIQWTSGAMTTAEFNSLQSCQYAIEKAQEHLPVDGICVPK